MNPMIIPPYLNEGDTIAVVSPARFMDMEQLHHFEVWANKNKWEVVLAPNLGKRFHQFGGTEEERISDIQWALENPDIKAVFSARGGYGTLRLYHELNQLNFQKHPKWWVGFSDLTVFHAVLYNQNLASIHGPMVMQFTQKHKFILDNQMSLEASLKGSAQVFPYEFAGGLSFDGPLWGGNLSIIFTLLAAGQLPDLTGKVLFIEDIDEYVYHIDRMMRALEIAGVFQGVSGLIVGSMTDMKDHDIPFGWNAHEIIRDVLINYDFPIVWGVPCGHDQKNFSLKLGMSIKFDGQTLTQP